MKKPRSRPTSHFANGPLHLAAWLAAQKISDAELARRLNINVVTTWRWKTSPTRMTPGKQAQAAKALGIWPGLLWLDPVSKEARIVAALFAYNSPLK